MHEADIHASTKGHDKPEQYEIRIKEHLDRHWADRFEGMTITLEDNGETLLAGAVVDQAALHGLLRKVRDLGLTLVSVMHVEANQSDARDEKADTDHPHSKEERNT
ncbi:MAG: hypothetical protein IT319_04345 [Anaerolineae bacterium]|nr:hypothetical protein [Anaerolineae bacterium]